jgi:HEPN domain-containing protein
MAVDPELTAETRAWFVKASNDLHAAEVLLAASPPLFDEALFHCQQAAEKALKGFLTWNRQAFRKTHNLEEIGEQCVSIDPALSEIVDRAVPLTEYAWKFRYPSTPYGPAPEEVFETLAIARGVFDAVLTRIPSDLRP